MIEDIRLENPIENNTVCGNVRGIVETGSRLTNIHNNLCFYNQASGIEIYLENRRNDRDRDIYFDADITNNTCDSSQYNGIAIHGVNDPNKSPVVRLRNNIVSNNSQYGLYLVDGLILEASHTGYYGNGTNGNRIFDKENSVFVREGDPIFDCDENGKFVRIKKPDFVHERHSTFVYEKDAVYIYEENPVIANQNPFASGITSNGFPNGSLCRHYLVPDCPFVNAGDDWAEHTPYRGMSTNADGSPDKDKIDLGFHRIDWERIGPDPSSAPFPDFTPIIEPLISPHNSAQWGVGLAVRGCPPKTSGVYGYVDGRWVGWLQDCSCMDDCCPKHMYADISEWSPIQDIKFIITDSDGYYYFSPLFEIRNKSPLSYCVFPSHCNLGDPLPFGVINTGTADTTITVEIEREWEGVQETNALVEYLSGPFHSGRNSRPCARRL